MKNATESRVAPGEFLQARDSRDGESGAMIEENCGRSRVSAEMANLPRISIVVVSHNNSSTIRAAVRSACDQSYQNTQVIVVDDCSTDGTREVLDKLRTELPSIELCATDENSGSAAAPRNLGIDLATGDYVTFLDGDDLLDRNAALNLASNAARHDVDIVSGQLVRRNLTTGAETPWHGWLFRKSMTLRNVGEFADLVYDSTSTGKAYRLAFLRRHGLRFPEGRFFEDNQFSAHALSIARGIRVVPDRVYYWLVYPASDRLTVTSDWRNVLSYTNRIDSFIAAYDAFTNVGHTSVAERLLEKTLKHDIWIFIDQAVAAKDTAVLVKLWSQAKRVLDLANGDVLSRVPLRQRAKLAALETGDLEAFLEANDLGNSPKALRGYVRDGRWYASTWSDDRAARGRVAELTAIAGDPISRIRARSVKWEHVMTALSPRAGAVVISGETQDRFGHFDRDFPMYVSCRVTRNNSGLVQTVVGRQTSWSGSSCRWELTLLGPQHQSWLRDAEWRMELTLGQGERAATGQIRSGSKPVRVGFVPRSPGILGLTRDRLALVAKAGNPLSLRRWSRPLPWGLPSRVLSTLARGLRATCARVEHQVSKDKLLRLVGHLARALPLDRNLVVFESHMGRQYSDSPRAIHAALQLARPKVRAVWSFATGEFSGEYQGEAVVRHSLAYAYMLGRAAVVIDNQGFPAYYKRRADQLYLQTWHGTPIKAMGVKAPGKTSRELEGLRKSVRNWSVAICPSDYFRTELIEAMGFTGETLQTGFPRNDALSRVPGDDLYNRLGLHPGYRYILWAPTFREKGGPHITELLDLEKLVSHLPKDVRILVRAHYLDRIVLPSSLSQRVVDVSEYEEVSYLYQVANLLVTDYSSVIFDFALTGKPIVVFAPDYSDYKDRRRGLNFDLRAEAPGPFVQDLSSLVGAISDELDRSGESAGRAAFIEKYCGEIVPDASEVVVRRIVDWMSRGK